MSEIDERIKHISPNQRQVLRALWDYFLQRKEWPKGKSFRKEQGRQAVDGCIASLSPIFIVQAGNVAQQDHYRLTIEGIYALEGFEGDHFKLVILYLEFLKRKFTDNPEFESVTADELRTALHLSSEDTRILRELFNMGNIRLHGDHASFPNQDLANWEVGVIDDIELLDEAPTVEEFLSKQWDTYIHLTSKAAPEKTTVDHRKGPIMLPLTDVIKEGNELLEEVNRLSAGDSLPSPIMTRIMSLHAQGKILLRGIDKEEYERFCNLFSRPRANELLNWVPWNKYIKSELEKCVGILVAVQNAGPPATDPIETEQPIPGSVATLVEDPRVVFVVHGRNLRLRDELSKFLRSIGLHPLEWSEAVVAAAKGTPYVGEILDAAFSKAQAVVVLMTPDDEARLRKEFRQPSELPHETALTPQARPNVLFEAGMAMGKYPDRTILVEVGRLRPFSDIGGRHVVRLDNTTQRRQELAQRLKLARCPVNLEGTDWHTTGDFSRAKPGRIPSHRPRSPARERTSSDSKNRTKALSRLKKRKNTPLYANDRKKGRILHS